MTPIEKELLEVLLDAATWVPLRGPLRGRINAAALRARALPAAPGGAEPTDNEPDRLSEVKARQPSGYWKQRPCSGVCRDIPQALDDIGWLVTEIERLRASASDDARLLAAHRRYHLGVGCPGRPECYVCKIEDEIEVLT